MRYEFRQFTDPAGVECTNLLVFPEGDEEAQMMDKVGPLDVPMLCELRLADGYGDYYLRVEGAPLEQKHTLGYKVDADTLKRFEEYMGKLIDSRFGLDDSMDSNLEFKLIDRSKFERLVFAPMPYSHKMESDEELEAGMDMALFNLGVAYHAVEIQSKLRQLKKIHDRDHAAAEEGKNAPSD